MLSMSVPLGQAASAAHEANRAPAAELLQSVREMKQELHVFSREQSANKDRSLSSTVRSAYDRSFSARTLQGWEQGRKQPGAAPHTFVAIASSSPKARLAVAEG
jgi:putative transcriptional regulator